MSNNNLFIRPCTVDDLPSLALLHQAAFAGPRHDVLYGNVTLPNKLQYLSDHFRHQLADHTNAPHPQHVHSLCVIDPSLSAIISHAVWIYLPRGYLASADLDTQSSFVPPGIHETLIHDFHRMTGELRSTHAQPGEAYWLLSLLATHPEHEGRGAGSMLIEWAFPKADEMGVKCCVDASAEGYALYRKRGFSEQAGVLELDLECYEGGKGYGTARWVAITRQPKAVAARHGHPSA
ncbi:MAG: hypothetical protein Q9208_006262 [Pyrenodesmia sp. 3 TL-2023]